MAVLVVFVVIFAWAVLVPPRVFVVRLHVGPVAGAAVVVAHAFASGLGPHRLQA